MKYRARFIPTLQIRGPYCELIACCAFGDTGSPGLHCHNRTTYAKHKLCSILILDPVDIKEEPYAVRLGYRKWMAQQRHWCIGGALTYYLEVIFVAQPKHGLNIDRLYIIRIVKTYRSSFKHKEQVAGRLQAAPSNLRPASLSQRCSHQRFKMKL